ncbi:hypothetical protein [Prosthecobacter vanneervenii]|uniref:Uncharacterized protein n=1 Tax=Prosthecobacter vanneervenii TaxID=48466 RepID=A0A7W7YFR9_9BACT|nr:hypothetical protein [Prosthecobacter vanneervenii]MBB5035289.1 hypothetical protein [Prosthecobacter vanneervenii]
MKKDECGPCPARLDPCNVTAQILFQMKRTLLILSLAAFCGTSSAESLPHDDLKVAWDKALSAIEKGRPRLDVAKDLEAAMAKTPASWWHDHANALVQDLRASDVKLRQLSEDRASAESSP